MRRFSDRAAEALPGHARVSLRAVRDDGVRTLWQRHGTREDEVDALLRGTVLVDLYAVVRQTLAISQPSYSIKKLEPFYGFNRTADIRKGDDSVVKFERWLIIGTSAFSRDRPLQ